MGEMHTHAIFRLSKSQAFWIFIISLLTGGFATILAAFL